MKTKISNAECISILTEINEIAPVNYFIAKNKGKNKKTTYGYLFNETEFTYQLIPIKKNGKELSFDKENIITLSKTEDIKKCVILKYAFKYRIKIYLNNEQKYNLVIRKNHLDKNQKGIFKNFRNQFKNQSVGPQILKNIRTILIVLLALFVAFCALGALGAYLEVVEQLQAYIEENANDLNPFFEVYDKYDLVLDDYKTVQHGAVKLNIPSELYIDEDYDVEGSLRYTNGKEDDKDLILVTVNYEPFDFTGEETEEMLKAMGPFVEKELGFTLKGYYDFKKAINIADPKDVNYFNIKETIFYFSIVMMKDTGSPLIEHYYNVETDAYCGFVSQTATSKTNRCITVVEAYPHSNHNLTYDITVFAPNSNQAYAIVNSIEIAEE